MAEELNEKVDAIDPEYIKSELEKMELEEKNSKYVSNRKLQKKDEEIAKLKKEIESLKQKAKESNDENVKKAKEEAEKWKNEYYKAYADMANLRRDIERDHSQAVKYRLEGFIHDLITSLDSFELSLKYKPNSEETKNFLIGFQFVYTSLLNILKNEGVELIEPQLDQKFDERVMEAVDKVQSDGEENLVKEVMLKGYKLYDHLIRPAMVKVSSHTVENKNEDLNETNKFRRN